MQKFVSLIAVLVLGGCSGMSEEQCQLADWETIGYEDGVRGLSGAAIGEHRKDCAKAGITPDRAAWEQGRTAGLAEYCRPANGYRLGNSGANYAGVCGDYDEAQFLGAYESGREIYQLRTNVNRIASQLNNHENSIRRQKDDIAEIEKALIAAETTPEQRVELLVDLKNASEELGELEGAIFYLQQDLANAQVALADAEQASASVNW